MRLLLCALRLLLLGLLSALLWLLLLRRLFLPLDLLRLLTLLRLPLLPLRLIGLLSALRLLRLLLCLLWARLLLPLDLLGLTLLLLPLLPLLLLGLRSTLLWRLYAFVLPSLRPNGPALLPFLLIALIIPLSVALRVHWYHRSEKQDRGRTRHFH